MTEQEQVRRDHLDALRAAGVEPYPAAAFETTTSAAAAADAYDDATNDPEAPGTTPLRVALAGRMMTKRVMGKAAFFHLADESGTVQAYVRRDDLPEGVYNETFKRWLDPGDWLGVEGTLFRTRLGEVTVQVERLVLLAKSLRPLPVEKAVTDEQTGETRTFNEVTDPELRYRQRYVDLALHADVRRVFRQRARVVRTLRDALDARGYVETETPALQPLYGGAAARPFTTHHNALDMPLFLRIADELYLKRLLVGGFEGVYEIAKDFRNEGLSRFHNPEFTMLELYVAYRDYDWMMGLVEELLEAGRRRAARHDGPSKPRRAYAETHTLSFARALPARSHLRGHRGHGAPALRPLGRKVARRANRRGVRAPLGIDVDDAMGLGKLVDEIFGAARRAGLVQPTFVTDYPVELSPLAKRHRDQARARGAVRAHRRAARSCATPSAS